MKNEKYTLSHAAKIGGQFSKAGTLALISCALTIAAHAQPNGDSAPAVTVTPDMVGSAPNGTQAPTLLGTVNRPPRPLPAILGLIESQSEKLERIYIGFASERIEQERKIADWQNDLQKAQSPITFDERNAARISKNVNTVFTVDKQIIFTVAVKIFNCNTVYPVLYFAWYQRFNTFGKWVKTYTPSFGII